MMGSSKAQVVPTFRQLVVNRFYKEREEPWVILAKSLWRILSKASPA
jgi:hypothetical protein